MASQAQPFQATPPSPSTSSSIIISSITSNTSPLNNHYIQLALLTTLFIGYFTYLILKTDSLYPGFKVFGFDKNSLSYNDAKQNYLKNARTVLDDARRKTQGAFQTITAAGPRIMFPNKYVNELKGLKELSFKEAIREDMFPHIKGFESVALTVGSTVIEDTVRIKLTQSLGLITGALCEETDLAIRQWYGDDDAKDWTRLQIRPHINMLVAQLSTRVFLGDHVCRNESWLRIAVDYTIYLMDASRALRLWPKMFRPLVHWFVPKCRALRQCNYEGRAIIGQEIKRRKEIKSQQGGGEKAAKIADSLGWMEEMAKGREIDLAGGQLGLTMAAIHTTSDLLTKCLYVLCTQPEYQDKLREEMVGVLSEKGWSKTSLYQMKLLDSFLKETQRFLPIGIANMSRVAERDIVLQDGTLIPKGAKVHITGDSMMDPNIYPEPEKFDAYRFLKLRSQPGQENQWQFVTTSAESTGFGAGIHACPGRFFASNEVKIALAFLLLRYDWRRDSPEGMPMCFDHAHDLIANPMFQVNFKRRKEEIDLLSCASKGN